MNIHTKKKERYKMKKNKTNKPIFIDKVIDDYAKDWADSMSYQTYVKQVEEEGYTIIYEGSDRVIKPHEWEKK